VLDQIFSGGEAVGGSRWLGITIEFKRFLKQLFCTRHEEDARRMFGAIERAAKRDLPDREFLTQYLYSHDPPAGPRDGAAAQVCRKRFGGRQVEVVCANWGKRLEDPAAWYTETLKTVRSAKTELACRNFLIALLGEEADSNEKVRQALRYLLVHDQLPGIRAECAEALEESVVCEPRVADVLWQAARKDSSDIVRAACAAALRGIAPSRLEVREGLVELFRSGPPTVRAGAARGLSRLDLSTTAEQALLQRFLDTITSPDEPAPVRAASIWAVASLLGDEGTAGVSRVIEECLDDADHVVSRTALHVLADAIALGEREWSQPLVETMERMLMAVTDPCPCLYGDLVTIVGLKEVHGGRRLEQVLADALNSFGERIRLAFIFGSVARLEQTRDSDIDIMIVGDVRLKDLAVALHAPEQVLGRTINPVLFSSERFREQYREGNPFLLDVTRKEKVFLKGSRDELTELVADRDPD
jgi:predicted nucleotidyltransferase